MKTFLNDHIYVSNASSISYFSNTPKCPAKGMNIFYPAGASFTDILHKSITCTAVYNYIFLASYRLIHKSIGLI